MVDRQAGIEFDLAKLRKLALRAEPTWLTWLTEEWLIRHGIDKDDAPFIAMASPALVIELIDHYKIPE